MKIIYCCFAGAHASVVASAIHCGLLPAGCIPTRDHILAVPYYDRTEPELIGKVYFMGMDDKENQIYFAGMKNERARMMAAIMLLLDAAGICRQTYILQDTFPLINFSTKFGGLLSKRIYLTRLGRILSVWGIQRQYEQFVKLVDNVKRRRE
ncbi:Hypothetical protein LUCI_1382 [Lucifera butyrica]|uniref:DUF3189 family protein n=1 Tax=Lucifera butyrica TaxID=1351585 RepID=A0A498R0U6_9FIRM|nr:DUF3189 family protein [Lucifera butyrica]VBB06166.1 Hypothetical protein LUCI_1382 [Lucifera butyrica]